MRALRLPGPGLDTAVPGAGPACQVSRDSAERAERPRFYAAAAFEFPTNRLDSTDTTYDVHIHLCVAQQSPGSPPCSRRVSKDGLDYAVPGVCRLKALAEQTMTMTTAVVITAAGHEQCRLGARG